MISEFPWFDKINPHGPIPGAIGWFLWYIPVNRKSTVGFSEALKKPRWTKNSAWIRLRSPLAKSGGKVFNALELSKPSWTSERQWPESISSFNLYILLFFYLEHAFCRINTFRSESGLFQQWFAECVDRPGNAEAWNSNPWASRTAEELDGFHFQHCANAVFLQAKMSKHGHMGGFLKRCSMDHSEIIHFFLSNWEIPACATFWMRKKTVETTLQHTHIEMIGNVPWAFGYFFKNVFLFEGSKHPSPWSKSSTFWPQILIDIVLAESFYGLMNS